MNDRVNKNPHLHDCDYDHEHACDCGHGHDHGHDCEHEHEHSCGCGHEHEHEHSCGCEHEHEHEHEHNCGCGHDHEHEHGCGCGHDHEHGESPEELESQRNRLIAASAIFIVLLVLEHVVKLPAMENRLVNTLCYLFVYLLAGWEVVKEAVEGVLHGRFLGEEFLMVLASVGAFATGENAEAAAVLLLYSIGELCQSYAVYRSRSSIKALMDLAPDYANRQTDAATGAYEKVAPEELAVGDTIVLLPGEKIPADSTVISGQSRIDTSSMTGESVPRGVGPGDVLVSGCINGSGTLTARVDKEYVNSTVSKVMELTETAADRKSKTEDFITKFARIYTPCVVGAAIVLVLAGSLLTGDFLSWLKRACTFLVISCPCALVISIPLSFFAGIGKASKNGILVKGSNYLEALSHVHTFASDKTGTLTKGEFKVSSLILPGGSRLNRPFHGNEAALRLLKLAAIAESYSDHPVAGSIRDAFRENLPNETITAPDSSETVTGRGIIAHFEGKEVLAGNGSLLTERGVTVPVIEDVGTFVYVAEDRVFVGVIVITDTIKPEAKDAIADLKALGTERTVILSGDSATSVRAVQKELGMDEAFAQLLPQDKIKKTEDLLSDLPKGSLLLYAGDGINDAPVLARADIGVAMGSLGSDAAIEAADVVVMDDDLRRIPAAIRIAKETTKLCRQNIIFALGVKLLFLVLAATGHANMWMAVFADVGVALLCVLNAMRGQLSK